MKADREPADQENQQKGSRGSGGGGGGGRNLKASGELRPGKA